MHAASLGERVLFHFLAIASYNYTFMQFQQKYIGHCCTHNKTETENADVLHALLLYKVQKSGTLSE